MTQQELNQEAVELLSTHFFNRNESNSSWVHFQSAMLSLPGLRVLIPGGAQKVNANGTFARDIACGYDMQYLPALNSPAAGYMASATQTALPPWIQFIAANAQYLSYGLDDRQHDIIGTEGSIGANEKGLTVSGWFRFTTIPASAFGLISKWEQTLGNQRSYRLIKTAGNNIAFEVSSLGTGASVVTATSAGVVVAGVWYYLSGRCDPGNKVSVFIDSVKTDSAGAAPAGVFNGTEPFEIGRTDRGNYLNGYMSNCYLAAAQHTDSLLGALWQQSRVMYGRGG